MSASLRKIVALAALAAITAGLVGCNTVQGAGKDLEKVGEEIQEEAEKHD